MLLNLYLFVLVSIASRVAAQSEECYSAGSIVEAVLTTIVAIVTLLVLAYVLWWFYWRGRRGKHLVLVTDPEKGGEYSFDNPGFKEGTPIAGRTVIKEEDKDLKWQNWSPVRNLSMSGKPRALDDSFVGKPLMNVVALRSHDFTGLGFNICGNMRDGIFVKDVLHRGPASESGHILSGDRIESIRISFRHMVFEDALTILSYASPYEVQLEVENGSSSQPATLLQNKRGSLSTTERICHPFYRSLSISDLIKISKSSPAKRANESSMADLSNGNLIKQAINETSSIEKMQKVGVRVLPPATNPESMKIKAEKSQNARNSFIENSKMLSFPKSSPPSTLINVGNFPSNTLTITTQSSIETNNSVHDFDEIDLTYVNNENNLGQEDFNSRRDLPSPRSVETNVKSLLAKGYNNLKDKLHQPSSKPEKYIEQESQMKNIEDSLEENSALNEELEKAHNTIHEKPNEKTDQLFFQDNCDIPEEVKKAGLAAKSNRKSIIDESNSWEHPQIDVQKAVERSRKDDSISGDSSNEGDPSSQKKSKRKAPPPPQNKPEEELESLRISPESYGAENKDSSSEKNNSLDSMDTDSEGGKSGTTIELNSSHITVHHAPDSENSRKAASLGDLSRIDNDQSIVVLERAVSLDLADGTPGGSKKRKAPLPPQEEFLDDGLPAYNKESKIDSTLHTRLKHSSDFGRLEDAVELNEHVSEEDIDFGISDMSTPEPSLQMLISSTPLDNNHFTASSLVSNKSHKNTSTVVNTTSLNHINEDLGLSGVHISRCSWDLSIPDSTTETFLTAINGNDTEDEDIPPELPTSPLPTYVTEIQVVTSNKNGNEGILEDMKSKIIERDDIFLKHIPEMTSFVTNNMHRPLSNDSTDAFNLSTKIPEVNVISSNEPDDIASLPNLPNTSDTILSQVNQVSLSQPNSLDITLQDDLAVSVKDSRPSGTLMFSSENMSDEQILAMKSSPEPIVVDTNNHSKAKVSKPSRSNVSVTSIRTGGSRIPIRAMPEPTQRKHKKENYVSFSSLNVSSANDKRLENGSSENSITHIVLDSQK